MPEVSTAFERQVHVTNPNGLTAIGAEFLANQLHELGARVEIRRDGHEGDHEEGFARIVGTMSAPEMTRALLTLDAEPSDLINVRVQSGDAARIFEYIREALQATAPDSQQVLAHALLNESFSGLH